MTLKSGDKQLQAVVIGYGSIGARHCEILQSMDCISQVSVLSQQSGLPYGTLQSLEEVVACDPDYVVIASPTGLHYEQLKFLEEHLINKKILVEKPLFDQSHDLEIKRNSVYTGYNLRFHPVLQLVKEQLKDRDIWSMNAICASYLPDWRPDRDYRKTASALKSASGGVLLELSHELDYVQWLLGEIQLKHAFSNRISDLEIETDDFLSISGSASRCRALQISLNYFTREPIRRLNIDGPGISISADLIKATVTIHDQAGRQHRTFADLQRNYSYEKQHSAVLAADSATLCTYADGLETMQLINNIRQWNQ